MSRKILYITGTRADYGLIRPVLDAIEAHSNLELEIIVTGMHLMNEFGMTANEIRKNKYITHELNAVYETDNKESMLYFIGHLIRLLVPKVKEINPDIILLLGDRGEMLAGAIVGMYLTIPVAHIHGGDVTSTVDESARHAITKLSHIHFPATRKSANRIKKMGENPSNIFVVGSPGLDSILNEELIEPKKIAELYKLDLSKSIILLVQHPVTLEVDDAPYQIRETLEAILNLKYQTLLIYPNADAGGRQMINIINEYKNYEFIEIYKSVPHEHYLSLMKIASVLVGNSSSGIIEAPSFGLPVVNVGSRQDGRERARNVIDVGYNKEEIKDAIDKIIHDEMFKEFLKKCKSPYGNGSAGVIIADILSKIKLDKALLQKKLTY